MLKVSDYLATGEEQAKTSRELCDLLHLDKRTLQAAIERERREGKPICASCNTDNPGYFLAGDKEEMQNYCDRLKRRATNIIITANMCAKSIDTLPDREA